MSESLNTQQIVPRQDQFQAPTLDQRAPDDIQELLGDPTAAGWGAANELHLPSILESQNIEQDQTEPGILKRAGKRIRDISDSFRAAPESVRLRWQSKRHLGAAAVLSMVVVNRYTEEFGGSDLSDKATMTTGLGMLVGAAGYKLFKYGLPGSKKNERISARVLSERQAENREWDENLSRLQNART